MNIHISKKPLKLRPILILSFILVLLLVIDFPVTDTSNMFLVKTAEAIVGVPVTPGSVAGARRRTRRRTRRRVTAVTAATAAPAATAATAAPVAPAAPPPPAVPATPAVPAAPPAPVTSVVVGTRAYALPAGCATVYTLRGVTYYQCGGAYYRPYFEGNSVVYVVENP